MSGSDRSLLSASTHFAFGRNWASYAQHIGEPKIAEAVRGLSRLVGGGMLDGKRFLDIGCGSDLHSLAALRLGAAEVLAVDIDADSVATTQAVLARHAPGGQFLFAFYRKTLLCGFWKLEKRWYAHAEPRTQKLLRAVYLVLFRAGLWVTGKRFQHHVESCRARGMDFYHDAHDWLGGYPYESILPSEVDKIMCELGLIPVRAFVHESRFSRRFGRHHGLLGSGCDEYVYARAPKTEEAGPVCAA